MRYKFLAFLLTLPGVLSAPAAVAQPAPDYAAIVAAADRSDADRKLDTNRAPVQWLAFIGAKPGMKILDIFAVYGWKAELLARAVMPAGRVYAQNSEAAFCARQAPARSTAQNPGRSQHRSSRGGVGRSCAARDA
jgi:predicted methyltransferase